MVSILRCSRFILSNFSPFLISSYSSITYSTISTSPKSPNPRRKSKSPPPLPPPSSSQIDHALSQLPPRFTPEDLSKTISLQKDPQICLHLFNWATHQPRFRHNLSTFLITIKKLGSSKLYQEMDAVVDQALAFPIPSSETLFNTIIYFYTEARKLSKAVTIYKHMKKRKDPNSHPTVRTYNLLFAAMLSRGSNSYINHMYMQTIRCLFRQMVDDGIEPDVFSLNSMIKGYVLSLHVNDALRVFHQMGVAYKCLPNAVSYDFLIHGLCAQGRTKNAKELYGEMKGKGFVPSRKAYNSLANCLAIGGEVDEAVRILWEMGENGRLADWITYRTVLDAIGRQGKIGEAMRLLKELYEKDMMNGYTYRKLLYGLQDDFGDLDGQNGLN